MTSEAAPQPGKMRALLEHVARALVDDPSQVVVSEELDGDFTKLHLQVAEADVGKVIGRGGRSAEGDPGRPQGTAPRAGAQGQPRTAYRRRRRSRRARAPRDGRRG